MCGLFGMIALDPAKDLSRADIISLKNRGPDNVGMHISGRTVLYHTRLAVIDNRPSSNQPLLAGGNALICNGEIYNHAEIRKSSNYAYQTASDCEAILAVYHEQGVEGFRRLKGMAAFALLDTAKHKLILYRDAVGKKPLFIHRGAREFLFSSNVTAIRANAAQAFTIDREAVEGYWRDGYVRPDRSIFQGILPLLPGMLLEIDTRTLEQRETYLEAETASYDRFATTPSNVTEEAIRLLNQSIDRRLAGLKRPVLLFSGGIDSTVLAQKMAVRAGKDLVCLSLKPLIPLTYDDFYARYAARRLRLNHIAVPMPLKGLRDTLEESLGLLDQPLALYTYYFLAQLTRKAREYGNVLFSGDGADEVFYGYSSVMNWFSHLEKPPSSEDNYRVGPPLPPQLSVWGRRQMTRELLGHAFVKVDKSTAEQQMEARCPYLDWDLMAFMRKVPINLITAPQRTKNILKEILVMFPDWFVERPKVGSAFNFRYLALPLYRHFYDSTDFHRLSDLGLPISDSGFNYKVMFENFGLYWKAYAFSDFLKRNKA